VHVPVVASESVDGNTDHPTSNLTRIASKPRA